MVYEEVDGTKVNRLRGPQVTSRGLPPFTLSLVTTDDSV